MHQIKLLEKAIVTEELQKRIDEIWEKESGNCFDGPILQFDKIEGDILYARPSTYRYYLASLKDAKVQKELEFCVVGVTGVVQYQGKCVIAKRSKSVTHPGIWEFAPAGTLPSVDVIGQLKIELDEELGLKEKHIALISFLNFEKDSKVLCVDLCYRIVVKTDKIQINDEYEEYRWISQRDLAKFNENVSDLFLAVKKFL